MTKEEFCNYANLEDTYTAFLYDSPSNRLQYSEGRIDCFEEDLLANTTNYSIEAMQMDSEIGQVICDNFANIAEIITDTLVVAHFTTNDGTDVYVLCPDARIFTVVFDDCDTCTETICQPTTYDMCAELIRARSHNKFADYRGGVAFISSIIPEIADLMGQDYYLVLLN